MMTLPEYRKAHGLSQSAFAKRVCVDQSVISRIEREMTPSLRLAVAIDRETAGKVPVSSWVQLPSPSTAPAQEAIK